ncbi:hypothetical protein [Sphingobium sp.]|uniref:hypothetical protein n=1 Tax=Sphingobium sp. TaxID=1912891 RepID=UPI0035C72542
MSRYGSVGMLLLLLGACGTQDTAEPGPAREAGAINEAAAPLEPQKRHRIDPLTAPPPAK